MQLNIIPKCSNNNWNGLDLTKFLYGLWYESISYRICIRCRGSAFNYLISVSSLQGCVDACNSDGRCCHYSYLKSTASHPDNENCYLYTTGECDLEDLRQDDCHHWRSGLRTTVPLRWVMRIIVMMITMIMVVMIKKISSPSTKPSVQNYKNSLWP